jgi:hypothetical protein
MSNGWQNLVVDMPASTRTPRGPRRAQPALRGLLPHPQLDRRLTQRLNSAFHRPIDCSLTLSVRAASAIVSSPGRLVPADDLKPSSGIWLPL